MNRSRIFTIAVVLVVVIVVAVVSWIAGSTIQSPAEAAARTAAPVASPILVPIEERVLTSDIVTRGTARFGLPQTISVAPSILKANVGIITTLPARNIQLEEGAVALTASGRPLFVLQGQTPAYRDLIPGIFGDDVLQLERGLDRLGFDPGPIDGTYDAQTATAVAEWYTASGFQAFEPTTDQLANIRTLEQELALAINEKATAEATLAAAPLAVAAAQADAENANKAAAATAAIQSHGQEKEAAEAAVEAARLAGEVAVQAALNAQAAAEREVKRLDELTVRLASDLELAKSKVGVQIPIDEIIFLPTLPARVEAPIVALGDDAGGPVMTVTNNQVVIDSSLRLEEAPLVKPGMPVTIDEPDLGLKATGVVGQVAETPGTFGADGFHIYFEVLVDETPLSLVGTSLRLTIPIESTGGAVTAVPVSALSLAADGTSRVQIDNGGSLEFVTVEPGLSTDGYVEIVPVEGSLKPGQLVVIGFE